jgi:hypothetical protein
MQPRASSQGHTFKGRSSSSDNANAAPAPALTNRPATRMRIVRFPGWRSRADVYRAYDSITAKWPDELANRTSAVTSGKASCSLSATYTASYAVI